LLVCHPERYLTSRTHLGNAALLLTPIPFSNIHPAVLIILIALAYIEEDGLLLCLAFLAAFILIGIESVAVWGTIFGALLVSDI
jgi:hypothetical protein